MALFSGIFIFRSEPDGSSVSRPELLRLHQAQQQADRFDRLQPASEQDSLQLEEQQRESRMRHIWSRLRSAAGQAKTDFAAAAPGGHTKGDDGHER